jgi:hypothetical protein
MTANRQLNPDCPKCGCGEHHVECIRFVTYEKTQRMVSDFACNACGHAWSTTERVSVSVDSRIHRER